MSLMLALLLLALLPTGKKGWVLDYEDYNTGAYAVCFFKSLKSPPAEYTRLQDAWSAAAISAPVIISITTLCVSYVSRVVKMHDTTSQWVIRRTRIFFGNRYKSILKFLHNRAQQSTVERNQRTMSSLKVGLYWIDSSVMVIGYRLALAVFLTTRVVLDLCDSMLWEVSEPEDLRLVS